MSNRIGGDFDPETIEAFRAAYAAQLSVPEDQDVDVNYNLPTEVLSNTSPWIEHTGLWKYPSGKGPDDDLKQPFNPEDFISGGDEEEDEDENLTEEEIEAIVREVLGEEEEDDYDITDEELPKDDLPEDGEEEEQEGLTEEEIESLINEILESNDE